MYKTFYGLEEAPFNLTPDPRFLFLSQRHREAIAALMFGINERKGFIALTGEIGSGKTTLCRALMNELTSHVKLALIFNPALSELELLQNINEDFGIPHESDSKKDLLSALNQFLLEQRAQGNTCILIIDESQNLTAGVLEQIRMISNLETETDKLIQIVLMGQPELAETLASPELEQLNQRITVRYHITPMTEEETAQYVRHRMFVAKAKVNVHLETPALRAIYDFTKGIPRRINVLMDHILLNAYVRDSYIITEDIVRAALAEVRGHAALGGDDKPKRRRARPGEARPPRRWVRAVAAVCVTTLLAGAAIVALQLVNLPGNLTSVFAGRAPEMTPAVQVLTQPAEPMAVDPSPVAYSTQGAEPAIAAVATDSLAAPPTAVGSGPPSESWVYDQSGICRVANPADAWQAGLVTLMSMASMQRYDLASLRTADEPTRQRAIEAIYSQLAGQGYRQVRLSGSLASLLRCEQPMILTLAPNNRLSPFAVLVGSHPVNGQERLILFDPVQGLTEMSRTDLGPLYQGQAVTVYRDPDGLGEIQPGETSDRVAHLQQLLTGTGHYAGAATRQYDTATREAVREFQRDHHLEATGNVDLPTALQLVVLEQQSPQEAVQSSTILDALRKASDERSHVRSPLTQGNLYNQARIQQRAPQPAEAASNHGVTTAALALGALVLTATVFIGIVVWASRTAGAAQRMPIQTALAPPASVAAAPTAAPPPATAPAAPSRVEQYMATQLQPPAPIPAAPPPAPVQVASAVPPPAPDQIVEVPLAGQQIGDGIVADNMSRELPPPDSNLAVLPDFERNWDSELAHAEQEVQQDSHSSPPSHEDAPAEESSHHGDGFRLEGIVWSETQPMAIISGQIVGVGDQVQGAQVTAIAIDSVTLSVDGETQTLRY